MSADTTLSQRHQVLLARKLPEQTKNPSSPCHCWSAMQGQRRKQFVFTVPHHPSRQRLTEHEDIRAGKIPAGRRILRIVPPGLVPPDARPTRPSVCCPHGCQLLDRAVVQGDVHRSRTHAGRGAPHGCQGVDGRRERDPIHSCCLGPGLGRHLIVAEHGCVTERDTTNQVNPNQNHARDTETQSRGRAKLIWRWGGYDSLFRAPLDCRQVFYDGLVSGFSFCVVAGRRWPSPELAASSWC